MAKYCSFYLWLMLLAGPLVAQPFVHPGINQTMADMATTKKLILAGRQPYTAAYNQLKAACDTNFTFKPFTHVMRGPYGRPNIGGNELSHSANMAYNYALVWYVTNDKQYAQKAIDILNSWSAQLWHFDYNDAKLLAAWTGHLLCNAAEILRYTPSGWPPAQVQKFSKMLLTVYYPLLRYYYPQANGNWDGAIIHSMLAIAIFTDNRPMFNNAVDHYLHAPVNGSLFKYIYPGGQCQETARDQAHVQLGLGEFAGAAQVAYTQGVDLFSVGDNRLAQGYEYTASFLLGNNPFSYGVKSERAKILRDDYEYVYRHYTSKGVAIPYTSRAADSIRPKAWRSTLTSVRTSFQQKPVVATSINAPSHGYMAGAANTVIKPYTGKSIKVNVGDDVQQAIDSAAANGLAVLLKAGVHTLPSTLKIPTGSVIIGEGLATVLWLNNQSVDRDVMVNAKPDMHNVTIQNLLIECSNKLDRGTDPNSTRSLRGGYNRGGIIFRANTLGQINNVNLINVTVQNATYNGVYLSGADSVNINTCDFTENGGNVVPGPRLQHNLLLTHCNRVTVTRSRLATSPYGAGLAMEQCTNVTVNNNEIARNAFHGILIAETTNVSITNNLVEGNDNNGIMVEFLFDGSRNIEVKNNVVQYNAGYALEQFGGGNLTVLKNRYSGNGNLREQQKIHLEKTLLLDK